MRQRPVHKTSSTEHVQRAEAKSHEYMYAGDLKAEFDALYAEGEHRRVMSVSEHDRIAGRPSHTKTHEEFITYAQSHPGVVLMGKDEIAHLALSSRQTIRDAI
jgi:hypothetical protein